MVACTDCGAPGGKDARFCAACGAPLPAEGDAIRKTVSVIFCDLVGSTALGDRSDPELLRELLGNYHRELRHVLEQHGGTVEKFVGDAVMAVFGIPQMREDDALRAVRAAVAMRSAVVNLGLHVRIGVNTGEVVAGAGETLVTGDAVNVAARLEQVAGTDDIFIGVTTQALVRDHVLVEPVPPLQLKGKPEPVPAFRLLGERAQPQSAAPARTAFVGRADEMELLERALNVAVDKQLPQLVTVVGVPGVGKSRLIREVLDRWHGRVVVGRCISYGEAITYWPLIEILDAVGDLDHVLEDVEDRELVATRVRAARPTAGVAALPEEIAWGFRRLLEELARREPLVVVVEDIHWAQPTLLDLVDYVTTFAQDAPVIVMCTSRPELFDARPVWLTPRPNALVVNLEALADDQVDVLISQLGDIDAATRLRVVDAAAGNPLFVEQLIAMVDETGDGADLVVPPTLHALLDARIDALPGAERAILERAAIEGRLFHRGAVVALGSGGEASAVGSALLALVRRQLIRPAPASIPGDDGFSFNHALIRDAVYSGMAKRLRAQLHLRYADWLEARLGPDTPLEIVGHHLAQSWAYGREFGPASPALAQRAVDTLLAAERAAGARRDVRAQILLLEQALTIVTEPAQRSSVLTSLARLVHESGDLRRAGELLREAAGSADARTTALIEIEQATLRLLQEPDGATALAGDVATRIVASAAPDDHEVLAHGWRLMASVHNMRARWGDQYDALSRVRTHARAAGDRGLEVTTALFMGAPIIFGPTPVRDGWRYVEDLRRDYGDVPGMYGAVQHLGAHLDAREGQFRDAAVAIADWRSHFRELGNEMGYAGTASCASDVLGLAHEWAACEQELREGIEILEAAGECGVRATLAAHLAHVLRRLGQFDAAMRSTLVSEQLGAADDMLNESLWRSARADLRSLEGRHDEATRLAADAVDIADRTDMTELQAEARVTAAEVARARGDDTTAAAFGAEALALFERKGNEVRAAELRGWLGSA